ncbi:hypothetical protein [Nocardioides sp. InS609-2]|uniref:hypothetical protein n=1 Tax=Nocardioides sp. InS609-2 TaxID=2760705 RepID=UPI0020BF7E5D|nr:hypothetical protein [Nocardioides sp. InS609-2]
MTSPSEVVAALTALGLIAAGGRTVLRSLGQVLRRLDRIETLTRDNGENAQAVADVAIHELQHNGGSTVKDDVYGIAVALGHQQRSLNTIADDLEGLRRRLDDHLDERNRSR